jgi:hypothetical protein
MSIVLSASIAGVLAIALILIVLLSGIFFLNSGGPTSSVPNGQEGILAVLLTDPPVVPQGTSALFVSYDELQVHLSSAGNDSGWVDLGSSGTINLMSLVNTTETIASTKIAATSFNAIRLHIVSAEATFEGVNYSVDLPSGRNVLIVPIEGGGIEVRGGETSVSVVDITPTLVLLGNPDNPRFELVPSAKAYVLPSQAASNVHTSVGEKDDVESNPYLRSLLSNSKFQITSVILSPELLSITVRNTGNSSLVFRFASIFPYSSGSGSPLVSESPNLPLPAMSEYFVVEPNSSLVPLATINLTEAYSTIASGGYLLPPSASVTFNYTGEITLGFIAALASSGNFQVQHITPGEYYVVRITASGVSASALVKAE